MASEPPGAAEAWQLEYQRILPELQQIIWQQQQSPPWPLRVLRSSQLDALRLDEELLAMLQDQFNTIFSLFAPGRIAAWEPELTALLLFLVFRLSVGRGRATPGSELMNLRYRDEQAMTAAATAAAAAGAGGAGGGHGTGSGMPRAPASPSWLHGGATGVEGPGLSARQKLLYFCGAVLLPYCWVRASRAAVRADWQQQQQDLGSSNNWHEGDSSFADGAGPGSGSSSSSSWMAERVWQGLRWLETGYKAAAVINMWMFLYDGQYRTLLERLIGARLVYKQPDMKRMISFEYLNRQLVWQELSEFMLFLLPLINTQQLKQLVTRVFPRLGVTAGGVAVQQYFRAPEQLEQKDAKQQAGKPPVRDGSSSSPGGQPPTQQHQLQQPQTDSSAAAAAGASATHADSSSTEYAREEPPVVGPCPICGTSEVTVPFLAIPCRHVFCYYCLRSHCEADARYCCPVDGVRVAALQRYLPAWAAAAAGDGD